MKNWNGQPYYPISAYFKNRFGEKIYKISVGISESCPNRKSNDPSKICIFCDELGSAGSHIQTDLALSQQIANGREQLKKRFRVKKFLVYFQPYTNTFARLSTLQNSIETALAETDVCGAILGTRPDCLPSKLFPILKSFNEQKYISVELGAQSLYDDDLEFLHRGHTVQQTLDAIEKLHTEAGVEVGLHLMFGLPNETDERIKKTAKKINSLPIHNVKLHNLHVLKDTELERLYQEGTFEPIDLEPYADRVGLFLQHLSADIAVQRLAAVAPRHDELIAPIWTKERMRPSQVIIKRMKDRQIVQGMSAL